MRRLVPLGDIVVWLNGKPFLLTDEDVIYLKGTYAHECLALWNNRQIIFHETELKKMKEEPRYNTWTEDK